MKFVWLNGSTFPCSVCKRPIRTTMINGVPFCGECLAEKFADQLKEVRAGLDEMKALIDKHEGSKCSKPENS